eukprot:TRINITY_DN135387_c0_g1_i1.p2 TRINITY_DN135387_c0_g1~~TRINITY_DN135387_c0_g1_i1.p2  ORF type:complete len:389 (+),score=56.79 TRINITY_DN135387_c0_g1_i1:105-1271(+)
METEPILYTCLTHNRANEIYCTVCKSYLCPECVSTHKTESHKPKYLHIMQYAPTQVIPKMDLLLNSTKESEKVVETEAKELVSGLERLAPQVKEAANMYFERVKVLKKVVNTLSSYLKQRPKGTPLENITKGLNEDKKRLEKFIKEKKDVDLLKLTQRIEEEANLAEKQEKVPELIGQLKEAIHTMEDMSVYKATIASAKALTAKCNLYRLTQYVKDWKCDRQFFSSKMYLSEDNLTFGNTASNGYPAIIGDVPFDSGLYAYEVIPHSLDCSGREGFGIIEREKYIAKFNSDRLTPDVSNDMMGFFYRGEAKNLRVIKVCNMQMDQKYYVKVNIPELYVTIKGPGVELVGELKSGVAYAPCFSCGCSNNRLKIRPLDDFYEGELADEQ